MSDLDEKGQLQMISVPLLYWQFLCLLNKKSVENIIILKMRWLFNKMGKNIILIFKCLKSLNGKACMSIVIMITLLRFFL